MLEVKNLSVGYKEKAIIKNTSISFNKGELVSIIGKNGSGKSTLLKSIIGILKPDEGKILIDGKDALKLAKNEKAKHVSYLSQGKSAPDMTVMQMVLHGRFPYLLYPRRYSGNDVATAIQAMKKMGIADLADMPISSLSGGMQQNAYIAMALTQNTDHILLDEPTTYLDIAHQISLMKTLRELASDGKCIVNVMHDLALAFRFSDRVILLDKGNILLDGDPREIYNSTIIKDIFGVSLLYENESNTYSLKY